MSSTTIINNHKDGNDDDNKWIQWVQTVVHHFCAPLCGSTDDINDNNNHHHSSLLQQVLSSRDAFERELYNVIFSTRQFQRASIPQVCHLIIHIIETNAHIPHSLVIEQYLKLSCCLNQSSSNNNNRTTTMSMNSVRHDDSHSIHTANFYRDIMNRLTHYIESFEHSNVENKRIKCERACLIMSDLVSLNQNLHVQYRQKIDVLENEDFSHFMYLELFESNKSSYQEQRPIWSLSNESSVIKAQCPMKVALSSANNSDRYGAAKLEGSRVLNMAVDLKSSLNGQIQVPIEAFMKRIPEQKIIFESYNDMTGEFQSSSIVIEKEDKSSMRSFFSIPSDKQYDVSNVFSDSNDCFRFYKYALAFSGIVQCFDFDPSSHRKKFKSEYLQQPELVWRDVVNFTQGFGLVLSLSNVGPSKSGFSSSSAVMTTLLSLCYRAMNSPSSEERLYDLALLAENELGLRSGWNDTYTVMPGIHDFITYPTDTAPPAPKLTLISQQMNTDECCDWLEKHLWLIHTGIQRKATGRMNRRHEVYLSRDLDSFPYLVKSILIHDTIVRHVLKRDARALGHGLTEYMSYRVGFDPQATSPLLQHLFQSLIDQRLIYGGLLAGAMGGGIAQVIVTEYALEKVANKEGKMQTRIDEAIEKLKQFVLPEETQPMFNNSLFGRIEFRINRLGIHVTEQQQESQQ